MTHVLEIISRRTTADDDHLADARSQGISTPDIDLVIPV